MKHLMDASLHITLPSELLERLRDYAWNERKNLSAMCRDLLELGMVKREEQESAAEVVRMAR